MRGPFIGVRSPAPNGDSGTTIDPLQYNCGNSAPTCGQLGESNGYFNGTNVDLLYSENYYCDSNVASAATTGCEAGAGPSSSPSVYSGGGTGTSLGNTTHSDTLYIPVPVFANAPPTQCVSSATCIDHPPTIDLHALATYLGVSNPATLNNVAIPAHNHVVGTRHGGLPGWWNVEVIATKDPATFATLTSVSAINAAVAASQAAMVPTNAFLFFQILPGTLSASMAADLTAMAPPGPAVAVAPNPDPTMNQTESGSTFNNQMNDCSATAPNCQNIGISHDWIQGQDVQALYTEQYFCDTSVSAASTTKCEAGAPPNAVPPGVAVPTAPSTTVTNGNIDPLYIPVPLYAIPPVTYNQCASAIICIDHPATIDLSRLAPTLGVANPASLNNVPLPGHDHLLTTRNGDQPEWWNVIVIPVTSPMGLASVENSKSYSAVKALETVSGSGIGVPGVPEIPTNAYLWFQTLPGAGSATPGPVQTNCVNKLPAGLVVGGAALDDGTGYYQVDSSGDVAAFGAATCYGALTGTHLNKPIVSMAVDRRTGGYWLVASDGGVFSFNAPFYGSTGAMALNKPIVSSTPTLNGTGYYLIASDGGVFTYGDAIFQGSTGAKSLNQPIVGLGLDRETGGYYLIASDGGVFSYNAPFYGSTGAMTLNKPIVGIAVVADGSGYRLIASDGGVFSYNSPFYGSTGNITLNRPVMAGLNNNSYDGYWLMASDGGVFTYGPPNAGMPYFGSAA